MPPPTRAADGGAASGVPEGSGRPQPRAVSAERALGAARRAGEEGRAGWGSGAPLSRTLKRPPSAAPEARSRREAYGPETPAALGRLSAGPGPDLGVEGARGSGLGWRAGRPERNTRRRSPRVAPGARTAGAGPVFSRAPGRAGSGLAPRALRRRRRRRAGARPGRPRVGPRAPSQPVPPARPGPARLVGGARVDGTLVRNVRSVS